MSKWSLNGWKAFNYIFLDQKLPSVMKISVENREKCILRSFSDRFLNFEPLPPPHFRDDWILSLFPYFLSIELGLAKLWLVLVHSEQSYLQKTVGGSSQPPFVQEGLMKNQIIGGERKIYLLFRSVHVIF